MDSLKALEQKKRKKGNLKWTYTKGWAHMEEIFKWHLMSQQKCCSRVIFPGKCLPQASSLNMPFFIYKIQVVNMRTLSLRLTNYSQQHYLHAGTRRDLHVASAICSGITPTGCNIEAARLEMMRRFPHSLPRPMKPGDWWAVKNSSLVAFRAHRSLNRCHYNAEHFSSLGRIGLLFGNNNAAEPEPGKLLSQLCSSLTTGGPSGLWSCFQPLCNKQKTILFPSDCSKTTSNPKLTTG